MSAKIEPISDQIDWSARAAAADALSRVNDNSPFVAIWLDEKGDICWDKANMKVSNYAHFALILQEFGAKWFRESM